MTSQKLWKLFIMAVVLFIGAVAGLSAQQYEVTGVEYLGDFTASKPRNKTINALVAKQQQQNKGITFTLAEGFNHFEMKMIVNLWEEELVKKVNIDSLWAVFVTPNPDITKLNIQLFLRAGQWPQIRMPSGYIAVGESITV
jgi:hypothetical protein